MALRIRKDKLKFELQLGSLRGWSTVFSLSLFPLEEAIRSKTLVMDYGGMSADFDSKSMAWNTGLWNLNIIPIRGSDYI
jgi:hypothetical protein